MGGGGGLFDEAKSVVSFLHKELKSEVEKMRHMKLKVIKPKIKIKCELPARE